MKLRLLLSAIAAVAALGLPAVSIADSIGPNCATCQGSVYTLEYGGAPIATTATTETYRITLTIDTSGYNGPGVQLNAVAIKVSSMLVSMSLLDAPDGAAAWTTWMGGLNANGCSNGGSGFECAYAGLHGVTVPDGSYSWIFDLTMNTGVLFTTPNSSSIKVRYIDANGVKAGDIVSENITLQAIPEPTTVALLGSGVLALASARRRRG